MGCSGGKQKQPDLMRMNTVTGRLKITVTSAQLTHETSVFKMDPYISLKLSNQHATSKVISKGGSNPVYNESFWFNINSCFRIDGRNLEIKVMDKNKVGSDKQIGFGIVDLDPIVNFKKPKEAFRCFLNYHSKPAGLVNLVAEFHEQQAQTLSFRFETATIRRKTSTFGNMNCWVHVVLGEEELKTKKSEDSKEHPPTWFREVLAFNISDSISECKLTLYDQETIVGSTSIDTKEFIKSHEELKFTEDLDFEGNSAGTLVFQTILGTNPVFSEMKTVHKKEEPGKGVEKQKNGKEQSNIRSQVKKDPIKQQNSESINKKLQISKVQVEKVEKVQNDPSS